MRILISGATGLIGKALVPVLQQAGHQISVLTTRTKTDLFPSEIKIFHWNPEKGVLDSNALIDIDAIISLAGANIAQRWTPKAKKAILDSRVLGTRLIVDGLKKSKNHQVTHLVSASAIGVYPSSLTKVYAETNTDTAESFPAAVVRAWETEVDKAKTAIDHVSKIRIGLVLAKEGGALLPLALQAAFGMGAWFGNGAQWQSWIHIQDLIRLFAFTLENPGNYNGVSPNPVTQKELVKFIAQNYKLPQWLPGIPKFVIKPVMGAMSQVLFDSINASSQYVENQGFKFKYPIVTEALEDLLPLHTKK